MEILNYGISGPNLAAGGAICADPTPNAILRIQRLRDNTVNGANGSGCNYAGSTSAQDHWPNVLYDQREALQRDNNVPAANDLRLGGVMHYIALDANNLRRWILGAEAPYNALATGRNMRNVGGYAVYFSDRRNNRCPAATEGCIAGQETGQYGFEDIVNPDNADGAPDTDLDGGEDLNANGRLDSYGQFPVYKGTVDTLPPGFAANAGTAFDTAAEIRPRTVISPAQARVNRAYLFRRALKLINGATGPDGNPRIIAPGLTVVSENPVYVEGHWNARPEDATATNPFAGKHVATSIIADAVTVLSTAFRDTNSFVNALGAARNRAADSYYRFAVIAGKNPKFARPDGGGTDLGTDGGTHNFLRMLENNGANPNRVNYRGSIATFYYSRQASGFYKGGVVYGAPDRRFSFDTDFLNPALLPPLTPVFRDINARGFTQEIRPGK
jgi:hypothetical protein